MSEDRHMSFGEHLDELRRRLWYATIGVILITTVAGCYGTELVNFLQKPIIDALRNAKLPDGTNYYKPDELRLISTNVITPLMVYFKISFIVGLFLSSPWVAYQIWKFVGTGLHENERHYVYIFAPVTAGLFLAGTVFSYYILVRYGVQFLVSVAVDMNVRILPEIDSTVMFVVMMAFVMGIVFELPVVMLILSKIGIFTYKMYSSKRRLFIIASLIVAAIITPTTDPVNLILATLPIVVLYEVGIWACWLSERARRKRQAG